jgi:hypothetical protein
LALSIPLVLSILLIPLVLLGHLALLVQPHQYLLGRP